jgi:hypothetical protein
LNFYKQFFLFLQIPVPTYFRSNSVIMYYPWCCPISYHILVSSLRATLDECPRSRDQWIQAILLVESFNLVPRPLDDGPRKKSGKLRLNLHGTCFGRKI